MMDPENYQLTRNDFELCAKNAFKNLLAEQEFSDVTLACNNNKQIKAHKVILGACSPFFKEILLKNPHQHPLIYLKGVGIDDLEAIIKFIYQGQTSISETNLDSFLASAQELQVEGLLLAKNEASIKATEKIIEEKNVGEMPELVENVDTPEDLDTIANYLKNSKVLPSNSSQSVQPSGNKFKCSVCDFETLYRKSLKRHRETVHAPIAPQPTIQHKDYEGSVDSSDRVLAEEEEELDTIADYLKNSKVLPSNASQSVQPPGNKFKCSVCDFETLYRKSLKRHRETVHAHQPTIQHSDFEGMVDSSDRVLAEESKISEQVHIDQPKENVVPTAETYKCDVDSCDFTTKHKWNIKRHLDRVHLDSTRKNEESLSKSLVTEIPMRAVASKLESSSHSDSFPSPSTESFEKSAADNESMNVDEAPVGGVEEIHEPQLEISKHQCDHCEFATTHKKNLRRHVLRLHGNRENEESKVGIKETAPEQRDQGEADTSNIQASETSSDQANQPEAFVYTCDKCDFTSDNKWNLTRHILRIHKEMKYPCDYCDYKASQTYRLKEHMQKKHR